MIRMIGLKKRPRWQATVWLTLWCFTLFSLLPGHLLPPVQASTSMPVVICTPGGLVEIDLATDSPADQDRKRGCGHCVLCFCPLPAGSSFAIVDSGFYPGTTDNLSLSATTAVRRHGRPVFWSFGAPRAPPVGLPA